MNHRLKPQGSKSLTNNYQAQQTAQNARV